MAHNDYYESFAYSVGDALIWEHEKKLVVLYDVAIANVKYLDGKFME
jgi:hypothetical protein